MGWRKLFLFLESALFVEWCGILSDGTRPLINFPVDNLIQPYAEPVVYCAASWTLQRASLAKTVPKDDRPPYMDFAVRHNLSESEAKAASLPTEVVDQRERKFLFCSSSEYFDFKQIVESVYLANLNLMMMLAYADGCLCYEIHQAIINDDGIRDHFFGLCKNIDSLQDDETALNVMHFLLLCFVRMRGHWFAQSMRAEVGDSYNAMEKMATRPKVASSKMRWMWVSMSAVILSTSTEATTSETSLLTLGSKDVILMTK